MVGEAEGDAVVARQAPAPGERGGAGVEVGLQGWGEGFHGVVVIDAFTVIPALVAGIQLSTNAGAG